MTAGVALPILSGSGIPEADVGFIDATVCSYIDDGEILGEDDALDLLQSAGNELEEDELAELASALSELTIPKEPEVVDDGLCELCDRHGSREFHHLVPKSTHRRYIKKEKLPENLSEVEAKLDERSWGVAHFLMSYGVLICGCCHKAIHKAEENSKLAEDYNTLSRLLEHEKIA
eukprot:CAMPEP_0182475338 /NCGR_PEP_ID=MMETSP1319-20130603/27222_1 /TAXON_ID=172717 /ORGANISM="Bolidomonas pacifica, Strain RCC208" /LENGTH=174 /DNA_ID=CAMNT_0024676323 /DNA_START=256 /DNA_END=777 /DNA_ORIENTATION=+